MEPNAEVFDFDKAAELLGVNRDTLPASTALAAPTPKERPYLNAPPLSDIEWQAVREALPDLPVPRPNGFRTRAFVDACLWHRCAKDRGHGWAALPAYFPPVMTCKHRWHRWALAGTWDRIAVTLAQDERISSERRKTFSRIADDAAIKRDRVLAHRARLIESL